MRLVDSGYVEKWQRDRSTPLPARAKKAAAVVADRLRARAYLHNAEVGANVRITGRPRIRNEGRLVIGDNCHFRSIVATLELYVAPGAQMIMGKEVHLNSGNTFAAFSRVELGDRVEVAPHVTVYDTTFHDLYERHVLPEPRPVIIEDDVWLGTKSTILPGVRIGRGAVVVAHALVTRDVEPFTIVSGVPAEPVAELDPRKFVVPATA
ncbi:MAG TPA: acyltransferase [Acidimicrobiales bacterium]|nr:acyltransferase [Acidimicrobiales bacterium]